MLRLSASRPDTKSAMAGMLCPPGTDGGDDFGSFELLKAQLIVRNKIFAAGELQGIGELRQIGLCGGAQNHGAAKQMHK